MKKQKKMEMQKLKLLTNNGLAQELQRNQKKFQEIKKKLQTL